MSASSSSKTVAYWIGLAAWTVVSLIAGQFIAALLLLNFTVSPNPNVQTAIGAALGYIIALFITVGLKPLVTKQPVSIKLLGVSRSPSWMDIGLAMLSVLPYFLLTAVVVWVGIGVGVIDPKVGQEIAFSNVSARIDYVVAFITFVIMAPLAEELLFRGYLLGGLMEKGSAWLAVIVSSVVFGLLHAPGFTETGIVWQWGAAADTFALAIVAGSLRVTTKNIWAGVILHAIKNGIAFYFLFVAPML